MVLSHFMLRAAAASALLTVCSSPLSSATVPAASATAPATTMQAATQATTSRSTTAEDARLLEFLDHAFDESVALSPQTLTSLGIKRDYARLDDYSDEADRKALDLSEKQLAQLQAQFKPQGLGPAAQLSYRLFEQQVERARVAFKWRMHRHPVSNNSSPTGSIPVFLINQHRVDTLEDARAYVSRVRDTERALREVAAGLEQRARQGIVAPKFTFEPVRRDARQVISGAPFDTGADSALFADFKRKVDALDAPAAEKEKLIGDARAALLGPFRQGVEHLLTTLAAIEPKAKGNDGAWSLPDGDAFYADSVKLATTTALTPDAIHRIGLDEVARITHEMEAIKARVGFKGSLQAFFGEIKTAPRFHYPNTEEGRQAYLKDAAALIDQVMAKAPTLFQRLPKARLEVRAVEKWRESTAAVAFYNRPSPDGSRPGIYYVNLADMSQVLKPQIEAISYHEGAPGHHFQIAFAQELQGLPKFRRFGGYGAYAEGWGLYSEALGKELGFYQDPYADFGRLSLEMWRAIRLVTDTGLHAKRWSREQAIDYFRQNTLLSERDIVKEVERYIANPAQATSYKIGQLEIKRLRALAQTKLGAKFDVRQFHDVVLGSGSLPLDVLTEEVEAYITGRAGD